MKLAKIFAILAAIFLVGAVAVGTLGPDDMSLGEGLAALDRLHLSAAEHFVRLHLSDWLWDHPIKALLVRPVWLVPASLGLLLAGACATAANSSGSSPLNSRRRRS